MSSFNISVLSIKIDDDRQRKDLGDITTLAQSFSAIGQITPIVVEPDGDTYRLIAGERRLTAAKKLGWFEIEAITRADLSDRERVLIELEENVRRKQLTWQEEVKAVQTFVTLSKEPQAMAAKSLVMSPQTLSHMLTLADNLDRFPELKDCPTWTSAYAQVTIKLKRLTDAALEDIFEDIASGDLNTAPPEDLILDSEPTSPASTPKLSHLYADPAPAKPKEAPAFQALEGDFALWAKEYTGRRFNLIHCDFPYGLNMGSANLQNSSARWDVTDGRYDDTPELFDRLTRAFFDNQDNFISDTAHCVFWLAAKNYGRLASRFAHYGWTVCDVPLIWHKSDNAGIAPDVRRWPRRTYEIAVFASRGDRKILKVKAASIAGPTTKDHHLSEKPTPVVTHFLEMLVDETTEIFDPTAGSGTALRAAKALGAKRGLGLDVLPEHVNYMNGAWND